MWDVIFFHSRYLINWDAGQFALGTVHYSLADHTPHPPGYFLFVKTGALFTQLTHDVNLSFVLLATLASAFSLFFFYSAVYTATSQRRTALITTLFLFLNPVFFYESRVALTYSFEALALCLSLWSVCEIVKKKNGWAFFSNCIGISLIMGFRPSVILAALPLLLFQLWHLRHEWRTVILGIGAGAAVFAAWFIPFARAAGGFAAVFAAINLQSSAIRTIPAIGINSSALFFQSLLLSLNVLLLVGILKTLRALNYETLRGCPFVGAVRRLTSRASRKFSAGKLSVPDNGCPREGLCHSELRGASFEDNGFKKCALPAAASAVFMTLFFLTFHFGEVGYTLALAPSLLFLLAPMLGRFAKTRIGIAALAVLLLTQIALIVSPFDWTGNRKIAETNAFSIRRHDERIRTYLETIRSFAPDETVIVVLRGQYFGPQKNVRFYPFEDIRLLSYYLPEYTLFDLLGAPNYYTTAHDFSKEEHRSRTVPFSPAAKKLIILADYLHPEVYPRGITLDLPAKAPDQKNIYGADIANSASFKFLGFTFIRSKK